MLTDIVSVMNVISVSAVRINGGTVCCAVVADICRVPVSFYMAAAGGKHGQQTDQDGFFNIFVLLWRQILLLITLIRL